MIYAADRVFPVDSPPFSPAAVRMEDGLIAEMGRPDTLVEAHPEERLVELPGCVLIPGLINLHSHLEYAGLAHLAGLVPFSEWITRLVRESRGFTDDDWLASARAGARATLAAGITCVADVVTRGAALRACRETGLKTVAFAEVVAVGADDTPAACEAALDRAHSWAREDNVLGVGLSPHSIYTVSPRALRRCCSMAHQEDLPLVIHAAETGEEVHLLSGTGSLTQNIERFGLDFGGPSTGAMTGAENVPRPGGVLEFLDTLGCLGPRTLLIHAVHVTPSELALVRERGSSLVACPRSNATLKAGLPDVVSWLDAGVAFGLGTDSLASVATIDLFEEVRAAIPRGRRHGERELARLTKDAADRLGVGTMRGGLAPGKAADFVALRMPDAARTTEDDIIRLAGPGNVVMTVVDGIARYHREDRGQG